MAGLRHVAASQLPEMLIRPTLFIALVGVTHWSVGEKVSTTGVMGLNVVAVSVALIVGTHMLHKTLPQAVTEASPVYHVRAWVKSALPLLFISGMFVVYERTSVLMLGPIEGSEAVGLYTVANRGAQLVTFVLVAVNLALGPAVADLYALGETRRLQRVVTGFAWVTLFGSLSIAAGLIVFGRWFLLLFGPFINKIRK